MSGRDNKVTALGVQVAVGVVITYAAGVVLGYRVLLTVALGGAVLLVVAGATVLTRPRVRMSRAVRPDRLTVGEPALARLTVQNLSRLPAPGFTAVDRIDGVPVEHPVGTVGRGGRRTVHYKIPTTARGLLQLGPLTVRRSDPFGLVRRDQQQAADERIWVHPRTHRVRVLPSGSVPDFEGRRAETAHGGTVTFSTLREYHRGDDPRRIHWRTTASAGTLMVREHVDTTDPTLTVLLDTRVVAMPPSEFEDAVEMAASIAQAALHAGKPAHTLILGEDSGRLAELGASSLFDRFAAAEQVPDPGLGPLVSAVHRARPGGALVVVTGRAEQRLLALLAEQRRRFAPVVVLTLAGADESALASHRRTGMVVLTAHDAADAAAKWNRFTMGEL